jgi:hypothetical protein
MLWYGYQSRYGDYNLDEMEKANGKSPIYYSGACGQEPTLADVRFGIGGVLTLHFLSSSQVYLTTTSYGYNPNEWGKIIGTLDVATYAKWIQDGVKIPGKNVEILHIGGYTVRRIIMEEEQPRPCNGVSFAQYQWVQDTVLLNFIPRSSDSDKNKDVSDEAFIKEIMGSLEVK